MIRVTQALSVIKQDYGPTDRVEAAAERGTRAHQACASYAVGLYPFLDDSIQGYFESFRTWFDCYVDEVLMKPEAELRDENLGFYGHLDYGWLRLKDGRNVIIDLKTPTQYRKTWDLQLAAYWHLVRESTGLTVITPGVLMLDKDGGAARVVWIAEPERNLALFMCALNLHRFMTR